MDMIEKFVEFLETRNVNNDGEGSLVLQLEKAIECRTHDQISLHDYLAVTEPYTAPKNYMRIVLGFDEDTELNGFWQKVEDDWREECKKLLAYPQQKFFQFLRENRVERRYKMYFKECRDSDDLEDFLMRLGPDAWVDSAFNWRNTDEGHDFWSDIRKKWQDACRRKFSFKVEIEGVHEGSSIQDVEEAISWIYQVKNRKHNIRISVSEVSE